MVCKVTANWSEKGQAVKRVAYTNVTYTPRVCVWGKKKQKTKATKGRQARGVQPGREEPGSQAGAKNMLMSIILCVICFHASSTHRLWQTAPLPLQQLLPRCLLPVIMCMNIHIHIHIRIEFALIIS